MTATTPSTKTASVTGLNSTGDNKALQDLGVAFKLAQDWELTVGQFKIQTTAESMQSTSDLLFAERSLLARTYGERRDPGLKLAYKSGSIKAATMISNGQGPNLDDKNTSKDISTRIEATLPYGISTGGYFVATDGYFDDVAKYGVNLEFTQSGFLINAEVANGNNGMLRSRSYSGETSYKLTDRWQLAARYETAQPNLQDPFISSADSAVRFHTERPIANDL